MTKKTDKTKKDYSIKKVGDDYEVTVQNVTRTFSLKDLFMSAQNINASIKELNGAVRLDKAVLANIENNHGDTLKAFKALSKLGQTAVLNYLKIKEGIESRKKILAKTKSDLARVEHELEIVQELLKSEGIK